MIGYARRKEQPCLCRIVSTRSATFMRVRNAGCSPAIAASSTIPKTKQLLRRRWTTKAWLICVCEFGGRRREADGPQRTGRRAGWTELFFLDEPTALAAGHRPCFFCRRREAAAFLAAVPRRRAVARRTRRPISTQSCTVERLAAGGRPQTLAAEDCAALPDGAMVARRRSSVCAPSTVGLCPGDSAATGRRCPIEALSGAPLALLTPRDARVSVLAAGYRPQWHASAGP